jgi:hypothetical protein
MARLGIPKKGRTSISKSVLPVCSRLGPGMVKAFRGMVRICPECVWGTDVHRMDTGIYALVCPTQYGRVWLQARCA